jgi:hypothetical protein
MIIQGEFFQIIPVNEHSLLFDLKLLYEIKGKNPRKEYKDAGYGLTLESAIKKCVQYAISKKYETLSLKEYVEEFRATQKEIERMLQQDPVRVSVPLKN